MDPISEDQLIPPSGSIGWELYFLSGTHLRTLTYRYPYHKSEFGAEESRDGRCRRAQSSAVWGARGEGGAPRASCPAARHVQHSRVCSRPPRPRLVQRRGQCFGRRALRRVPEELAQYVNQGTAFVYIVWSSAILLVQGACRARGRRCRCFWDHEEHGAASRARSTAPWYILVGIGLFNGSGNFCMALAQPHTSGLTQTLLNLLGIPLVMVLSWVFLRKPSSRLAVGGAILIVIGTACSSLRSEFEPSSGAASPVALFVWAPFLCGRSALLGW